MLRPISQPANEVLGGEAIASLYGALVKQSFDLPFLLAVNLNCGRLLRAGSVEWVLYWGWSWFKHSDSENGVDSPHQGYFELIS